MHPQPAGGFRDVEAGFRQGLVNAFPFQGFDRGGAAFHRHLGAAVGPFEGGFDVVGVGGFGQVMAGAQLDRFHRRGDAGVAGEHHDQRVRVVLMEGLYAGEPGGVALEFQVHHRVAGPVVGEGFGEPLHAFHAAHLVAAPLERAAQGARQRGVVLDDQQPPGAVRHLGFGVHQGSPCCASSSINESKGSDRVTSAPPWGRLRASSPPPRVRATLTTRNRPRPLPARPLVE